MGEIIASRNVNAVHPDGRVAPLSIQLGTARYDAGMSAWACPCRIVGFDGDRVRRMFGVDSLQAVVIATDMLRRLLSAAAVEHGWTFTWDTTPDLGLTDVLW